VSNSKPRYVFSTYSEENFGVEEFDTRADALEAARYEDPNGTAWTGVKQDLDVQALLENTLRNLPENLCEEAFEVAGQIAYDLNWPEFEEGALKGMIQLMAAAALPHIPKPPFFAVVQVEEHELDECV